MSGELVKRLRRMAKAIYLVADKSVAEDISKTICDAIIEIDRFMWRDAKAELPKDRSDQAEYLVRHKDGAITRAYGNQVKNWTDSYVVDWCHLLEAPKEISE